MAVDNILIQVDKKQLRKELQGWKAMIKKAKKQGALIAEWHPHGDDTEDTLEPADGAYTD